jgi:hypothetical protein
LLLQFVKPAESAKDDSAVWLENHQHRPSGYAHNQDMILIQNNDSSNNASQADWLAEATPSNRQSAVPVNNAPEYCTSDVTYTRPGNDVHQPSGSMTSYQQQPGPSNDVHQPSGSMASCQQQSGFGDDVHQPSGSMASCQQQSGFGDDVHQPSGSMTSYHHAPSSESVTAVPDTIL